ncbi:hypothetical protein LZ32DRAFT_104054 [Colletotrichum eremochloae]|nr:hypothetical protein LZ32DRAFT_104054 [Colletotrichum eremochloae]
MECTSQPSIVVLAPSAPNHPSQGTELARQKRVKAGQAYSPLPPNGEQEGFSGSNFTIGGDQGGSLLGYSELVKWHGFRPFELMTLGRLRSRPYLAAGTRHPALLSAPFSQLKPHAAGAKSNDRAHLPNVKASSGLHWNQTEPPRQVAAGRFANLYRIVLRTGGFGPYLLCRSRIIRRLVPFSSPTHCVD